MNLRANSDQTTQSYKRLETEQRNAQRLASSGFGRSIQSVNKYKDSIRNVGSTMRSVGSTSMLLYDYASSCRYGNSY